MDLEDERLENPESAKRTTQKSIARDKGKAESIVVNAVDRDNKAVVIVKPIAVPTEKAPKIKRIKTHQI